MSIFECDSCDSNPVQKCCLDTLNKELRAELSKIESQITELSSEVAKRGQLSDKEIQDCFKEIVEHYDGFERRISSLEGSRRRRAAWTAKMG